MISKELKQFIKDNKDLMNYNTKNSWEEIYEKLPKYDNLRSEFTQTILDAGINDPAMVMGYIPERYLYRSKIEHYTIPSTVTSIGKQAFESCSNLTHITIPDSVTYIGVDAFDCCRNLTHINIPGSVTRIDYGVFNRCTNIESVKIDEGLTSISSVAFANCERLTSFTLPKSVNSIAGFVFTHCYALKEITFKGTKKQAIKLGIGEKSETAWRSSSSIQRIICSNGVIEL